MDKMILVYSTAPDMEVAGKIAKALVDDRLAACVGMLPGMKSVYRWQGKVDEAVETCLMIKTKQSCFSLLSEKLTSLHPYDLPEIVVVPVSDGLPAYLQWVEDETV